MSWVGPAEREMFARNERLMKVLAMVDKNPGKDSNDLFRMLLFVLKVQKRTFLVYLQELIDAGKIVRDYDLGSVPLYYTPDAYEETKVQERDRQNRLEIEATSRSTLDAFILERTEGRTPDKLT